MSEFGNVFGPNELKELLKLAKRGDPPQQPGECYWQKRMERERERADSAEADFQALSDNYDELKKAKDYWERKRTEHKNRADRAESLIQQKDAEIAELKQSKRFELIRKIREKADKDTYALAEECVRLEGELKTANLAYEGLQANCVSRGEYEATLKKLDDMTKAYHALQREYERFQQVAKGWNEDFQELETKWTEAKAETARIKKTIEGLKMLYKATRRTEEDTP
ncbi:Chromosome partition protein Smc [compost metagenome]